MMAQCYHEGTQTNYTLHLCIIYALLYSYYVADLMKKLELRLIVVSVLLKIKFGHAHIRVPKIGKPMLETPVNFLIKYINMEDP